MSKIGEAYMTEVSAEDIAAVWFEHEHPGETYDKIIVEEDRGIENDELTWVVFYNDGKVVAMADINLDFYGDLYF